MLTEEEGEGNGQDKLSFETGMPSLCACVFLGDLEPEEERMSESEDGGSLPCTLSY